MVSRAYDLATMVTDITLEAAILTTLHKLNAQTAVLVASFDSFMTGCARQVNAMLVEKYPNLDLEWLISSGLRSSLSSCAMVEQQLTPLPVVSVSPAQPVTTEQHHSSSDKINFELPCDAITRSLAFSHPNCSSNTVETCSVTPPTKHLRPRRATNWRKRKRKVLRFSDTLHQSSLTELLPLVVNLKRAICVGFKEELLSTQDKFLEDAHKVFDENPERDKVTLATTIHSGCITKAGEFFDRTGLRDVPATNDKKEAAKDPFAISERTNQLEKSVTGSHTSLVRSTPPEITTRNAAIVKIMTRRNFELFRITKGRVLKVHTTLTTLLCLWNLLSTLMSSQTSVLKDTLLEAHIKTELKKLGGDMYPAQRRCFGLKTPSPPMVVHMCKQVKYLIALNDYDVVEVQSGSQEGAFVDENMKDLYSEVCDVALQVGAIYRGGEQVLLAACIVLLTYQLRAKRKLLDPVTCINPTNTKLAAIINIKQLLMVTLGTRVATPYMCVIYFAYEEIDAKEVDSTTVTCEHFQTAMYQKFQRPNETQDKSIETSLVEKPVSMSGSMATEAAKNSKIGYPTLLIVRALRGRVISGNLMSVQLQEGEAKVEVYFEEMGKLVCVHSLLLVICLPFDTPDEHFLEAVTDDQTHYSSNLIMFDQLVMISFMNFSKVHYHTPIIWRILTPFLAKVGFRDDFLCSGKVNLEKFGGSQSAVSHSKPIPFKNFVSGVGKLFEGNKGNREENSRHFCFVNFDYLVVFCVVVLATVLSFNTNFEAVLPESIPGNEKSCGCCSYILQKSTKCLPGPKSFSVDFSKVTSTQCEIMRLRDDFSSGPNGTSEQIGSAQLPGQRFLLIFSDGVQNREMSVRNVDIQQPNATASSLCTCLNHKSSEDLLVVGTTDEPITVTKSTVGLGIDEGRKPRRSSFLTLTRNGSPTTLATTTNTRFMGVTCVQKEDRDGTLGATIMSMVVHLVDVVDAEEELLVVASKNDVIKMLMKKLLLDMVANRVLFGNVKSYVPLSLVLFQSKHEQSRALSTRSVYLVKHQVRPPDSPSSYQVAVTLAFLSPRHYVVGLILRGNVIEHDARNIYMGHGSNEIVVDETKDVNAIKYCCRETKKSSTMNCRVEKHFKLISSPIYLWTGFDIVVLALGDLLVSIQTFVLTMQELHQLSAIVELKKHMCAHASVMVSFISPLVTSPSQYPWMRITTVYYEIQLPGGTAPKNFIEMVGVDLADYFTTLIIFGQLVMYKQENVAWCMKLASLADQGVDAPLSMKIHMQFTSNINKSVTFAHRAADEVWSGKRTNGKMVKQNKRLFVHIPSLRTNLFSRGKYCNGSCYEDLAILTI